MSTTRNKLMWFKSTSILVLVVLVTSLIGTGSVLANLTGSNFNTEDGNLKTEAGDTIDWESVTEIRVNDLPSGQNDDSFTQGTKEDTTAPVQEFGSIPPNKSDLKTFGVYKEEGGTAGFLHMYWTRVQDPSGTTNMDFEFNKNKCVAGDPNSVCSSNNLTPARVSGDLLITYELAKGGTVPRLFLLTWLDGSEGKTCDASNSFPCWGDRIDLSTAGAARGSINTVAIPAGESDGLGALSARTFGEASVDLSIIFEQGKCESFGSAYLKSRSSDSFTSALKDFIAPVPVNIANCGSVVIRKQTDPDEANNTTLFGYTKSFNTDPATGATFQLADDGVQNYDNTVLFGSGYTVTEDVLPSGWDFVNVDCSASTGVTPSIQGTTVSFAIDDEDDVLDCTYTNRAKGTIIVVKKTNDSFGAFDFTSNTLGAFTLTTTAVGDAGKASQTFANLATGTYDVSETVPAGWNLVSATCDDSSAPASISLSAGETVTCTFVNELERGAIKITKTRKHAADGPGDHPHAGVQFTVNGQSVTTDANGAACVGNLLYGQYNVVETVPSGYVAVGATTKSVTVSQESVCGDGKEATVSFQNMPLTNITVSVDSQVDGGTASTIQCVLQGGATVASGSTGANGDGSATANNLQPGTYVCTVVVDP